MKIVFLLLLTNCGSVPERHCAPTGFPVFLFKNLCLAHSNSNRSHRSVYTPPAPEIDLEDHTTPRDLGRPIKTYLLNSICL